jgi:hypothetical protein
MFQICADFHPFNASAAPERHSSELLRTSLDRTPTHGYAATRETAMTAFAKSWRR